MSIMESTSNGDFSAPPREIDYIQASNNVIDLVSEILDEIVKENSQTDQEPEGETPFMEVFSSKKPPKITINKYLKRIMKYSKPEPSTIIIALIYIDKICETSNLVLTQYNIHR